MKKMMSFVAVVSGACLAVLMLSGCCCGKNNAAMISVGGWELELESLAGSNRAWQEPAEDITLIIQADGRFSGCAGVNRYFGNAKFDPAAGSIKFETAGVTMMAGPGAEYEAAFLKMLSTADSYRICGDELYLKSNGKTVAEFDHESIADLKD